MNIIKALLAILLSLVFWGCGSGGGSSAEDSSTRVMSTTIKATGPFVVEPQMQNATPNIQRLYATAGIVSVSWDGTKVAYGIPISVEATSKPGIDVVITTDHPELFDSVATRTDSSGMAKVLLLAKDTVTVETRVSVSAQTGQQTVTASSLVFMPSQLKLTAPALGVGIKGLENSSVAPPSDAVSSYTSLGLTMIRLPWLTVSKFDNGPRMRSGVRVTSVADGLTYEISAMGMNPTTLELNNELYGFIDPTTWNTVYPLGSSYGKTLASQIPQFTEISIPAAGINRPLGIIWNVTVTLSSGNVLTGYTTGAINL